MHTGDFYFSSVQQDTWSRDWAQVSAEARKVLVNGVTGRLLSARSECRVSRLIAGLAGNHGYLSFAELVNRCSKSPAVRTSLSAAVVCVLRRRFEFAAGLHEQLLRFIRVSSEPVLVCLLRRIDLVVCVLHVHLCVSKIRMCAVVDGDEPSLG